MRLTASQALGIKHLRQLPNGLDIFKGPPGTGKSHFIAQSILPILKHTEKKILLVTPSNDPVNDLAAIVHDTLVTQGLNDKMIICLHSENTEQDIFGRNMRKDTIHKHKSYPILEKGTVEEEESLSTFKTVLFNKAFYKHVTEKPYNVQDKGAWHLHLSLGMNMLRVGGFLNDSTYDQQWDILHQLYDQKIEGSLDHDRQINLRAKITKLRNHTILQASVVIMTCTNVNTGMLWLNYNRSITYVDKAAKVLDLI